jgi:hypothetical protein
MSGFQMVQVDLAVAKEEIHNLLNAIETESMRGKPEPFVFFFHQQLQSYNWFKGGEEWDSAKAQLLADNRVEHKSTFRDVWKSAAGHSYNALYHQFTQEGDVEHSQNSIMMMAFRSRTLPCTLLYIEFVPITDSEYDKLEKQYTIRCAAGGECVASGLSLCCSRCKVALYCSVACQRKHWPLHKPVCNNDDQQ